MTAVILIVGGSAGAIMRYLAGKWLSRFSSYFSFPIAMLAVNIIGSFGLGLFFVMLQQYGQEVMFLLVGTAFFGAFTTFSTFSVEAFQLLEERKVKPLFYYVFISFAGSVISFLIGSACSIVLLHI